MRLELANAILFLIVKPRPKTPKPQIQKPKTKGPWAYTKISWATTPPHPTYKFTSVPGSVVASRCMFIAKVSTVKSL